MVVKLGTALKYVDNPWELFACLEGYDIKVESKTDETGQKYVVRKIASHVNPNGLREDVYEELFDPGEDIPYSKRYFPEERARNARPTSLR